MKIMQKKSLKKNPNIDGEVAHSPEEAMAITTEFRSSCCCKITSINWRRGKSWWN